MARLIPKIHPSEITNDGERKVAEALISQLPSKVEVFHSFHYMTTNARGMVREGECDFIIVDPSNGILFVEVKGGSLEFDPKAMEWLRIHNGKRKPINKDPFVQARECMHEITDHVRASLPYQTDEIPFTYGFAVAFPDCTYSGPLPRSTVPDLVLDAAKNLDLEKSVQKVFDRFRRKPHPELSSKEIQAIHEALYPKFAILPVLWRKVEDQEERLLRQTTEQQRLLDFLGDRKKAAIQGVAGSGKTILGIAKAQEMARRNLRTLFLCYNSFLKEWLQDSVSDSFGDNLIINNYHSLVTDLGKEAGLNFRVPAGGKGQKEWFDNKAPELLMRACEVLGAEHKFDAVIVDEGQDFQDLWWTSIDEIFRNPDDKDCYYVFYDPKQNIFVPKPGIPDDLGDPFDLPVNCRNTVSISEHCSAIINHSNQVRSDAPIGDKPEIRKARNLEHAFREAGTQIRKWCMPRDGGLKFHQVVMLAPGYLRRSWPKNFDAIPATQSLNAWRNNKGVLITSTHSFKGLEADAIVVIEAVNKKEPDDEIAERYVACSRAKHLLTVIQWRRPS